MAVSMDSGNMFCEDLLQVRSGGFTDGIDKPAEILSLERTRFRKRGDETIKTVC